MDYAKAVDCVDHNKLWKILQEMGIPDYLTCLLRNLYPTVSSQVRPWPASCLLKVTNKVTQKFPCPSPLPSFSLTPGLTGPQADVHVGSGMHQLVTWRPGLLASGPSAAHLLRPAERSSDARRCS